MNVGVDLRIVDTRSLIVVRTASLQKQIIGQEVGAGIYRFFGNELLDVNVGSKKQEPLQLGVRTTIEQGVLELLAGISGVDAQTCLEPAAGPAAAPHTPVAADPVAQLIQPVAPVQRAPVSSEPSAALQLRMAERLQIGTSHSISLPGAMVAGARPASPLAR